MLTYRPVDRILKGETLSLFGCSHRCSCRCHTSEHVKHFAACCDGACLHCRREVRNMEDHLRECHGIEPMTEAELAELKRLLNKYVKNELDQWERWRIKHGVFTYYIRIDTQKPDEGSDETWTDLTT